MCAGVTAPGKHMELREKTMPEIKTFKNIHMVVNSSGNDWYVYQNSDTGVRSDDPKFPTDAWDMEVTFTRKVKPIDPGHWYQDQCGCPLYTLAVNGTWAWVTGNPDLMNDNRYTPDMVVNVNTLRE